jgi:hypothetical protein
MFLPHSIDVCLLVYCRSPFWPRINNIFIYFLDHFPINSKTF